MSDMEDMSAFRAEESVAQGNQAESVTAFPSYEAKKVEPNAGLKDIVDSLDGQSYFLGEVPQSYLADPQAFLPLNSDRLIGSSNAVEGLLSEVSLLIQEEVNQINKEQKQIALWEDRIEKNKSIVQKQLSQVKQNLVDIAYDKKNRDFWWERSEQVLVDYVHTEAAGREADWAWLIKKYGLKNPDGTSISEKGNCVEELCNGASNNLATEYKAAGQKYDQKKRDKEAENVRLIGDNGKLLMTNEQLQKYITNLYANEIEPLQDGVLLFKELGVKLKVLGQEGSKSSYGDLRSWAESFVDTFLKTNPRVPQRVVHEFRRLSSIPLPAQNS